MYRLGIDLLGADNSQEVLLNAVVKFATKNPDYRLCIYLKSNSQIFDLPSNIEKIECAEEITQKDNPLSFREKTQSSLVKLIDNTVNGWHDGIVTCANSANLVTLCSLKLNKISIARKLAFMPIIPTPNQLPMFLLDVGANLKVEANQLVAFAYMAEAIYKSFYQIAKPKVYLANVGEENTKGIESVVEANKLLSNQTNLNFQGNIEARDILNGHANIVVCDGWTGNFLLKSYEGAFSLLFRILKSEIKNANIFNKIFLWFSKNIFKNIKKKFDYKNTGGALVVGVDKLCIKAHGSSDEQSFYNALVQAKIFLENKCIDKLKELDEKLIK